MRRLCGTSNKASLHWVWSAHAQGPERSAKNDKWKAIFEVLMWPAPPVIKAPQGRERPASPLLQIIWRCLGTTWTDEPLMTFLYKGHLCCSLWVQSVFQWELTNPTAQWVHVFIHLVCVILSALLIYAYAFRWIQISRALWTERRRQIPHSGFVLLLGFFSQCKLMFQGQGLVYTHTLHTQLLD